MVSLVTIIIRKHTNIHTCMYYYSCFGIPKSLMHGKNIAATVRVLQGPYFYWWLLIIYSRVLLKTPSLKNRPKGSTKTHKGQVASF